MTSTEITLRNRAGEVVGVTILDPEDAVALGIHRWHLTSVGYVGRNVRLADGTRRISYMHREILGLARGDSRTADHINRDKLDNRRQNLRITTRAQNNQNVPSNRNSSSRFRGVCWDKRAGRWVASAQVAGVLRFLGYFDDEVEAASVASAFRAAHMPFAVEAVAA